MSKLIYHLAFPCAVSALLALSGEAFANSRQDSMTIRYSLYTSEIIECKIISSGDMGVIINIVDKEVNKKVISKRIRSRADVQGYTMQIDSVRGGGHDLYTFRMSSLLESSPNHVEIETRGEFYKTSMDYLIGIDRVTKHGRARFCRKLSSR